MFNVQCSMFKVVSSNTFAKLQNFLNSTKYSIEKSSLVSLKKKFNQPVMFIFVDQDDSFPTLSNENFHLCVKGCLYCIILIIVRFGGI